MTNFILFVVAIALFLILFPMAITAKLTKIVIKRKLDYGWFGRLAASVDRLGNVMGDDLFNFFLVKAKSKNRFGSGRETISSVIGKNYKKKQLTVLGTILRNMLNLVETDHSIKSIGK